MSYQYDDLNRLSRVDVGANDNVIFDYDEVGNRRSMYVYTQALVSAPVPLGAAGLSTAPTLRWNSSEGALAYRLQVARDSGYGQTILDDSTLTDTAYALDGLSDTSRYYWKVNKKFVGGTSNWSTSSLFHTLAGAHVYSFRVNDRWNLVSVPLSVSNPRQDFLFPDAASYAYAFQDQYSAKDSLAIGAGYWLKFPSGHFVSITGSPTSNDTIELMPGWNLIGSVGNPVIASSIAADPSGIISSPYFGYGGGYRQSDTLMPGRGYWLKSADVGRIFLAPGAPQAVLTKSHAKVLSDLNRLEVEDADHAIQRLYFGVRGDLSILTTEFELPPPPPRGAFDARFASDQMVEIIQNSGSRELPISISTPSYPVKLRWEIKSTSASYWLALQNGRIPMIGTGEHLLDRQQSLLLHVRGASRTPERFVLEQNYPNPFNPRTTIKYRMSFAAKVRLEVYGLLGQRVAVLEDGWRDSGYHEVSWDASATSSGLYFYRLEAVDVSNPANVLTQVKKMVLIK